MLTYDLADELSKDFKTGGKANQDVLEVFSTMSDHIVGAKCDAGRDDTTRIVQLMSIPLIQGTLKYANIIGVQGNTSQKTEAAGAAFAASVLPLVADCNAGDAETIYNNMKTGQTNTDYTAVKAAFESNYECLGITAADVGELEDAVTPVSEIGSGNDGGVDLDSGTLQLSAGIAFGVAILVLFI